MGIFQSKGFIRKDDIDGQGRDVLMYAKMINLKNNEIDRFFNDFSYFKEFESNVIDLHCLLKKLRVQETSMLMLFLLLFDKNKYGALNFQEYMISIWNFLTLDDEGIAMLLFTIFDTNGSNILEVDEIKYMVIAVWEFHPPLKIQRYLRKLDSYKDGLVTLPEYMLFYHHFSEIFSPLCRLRLRLRKKLVFHRFWKELCRRRHEDFRYMSIFLIIKRDDPEYAMFALEFLAADKNTPKVFSEQWKSIIRKKDAAKYKVFDIPTELITYNPPPIVKKTKSKSRKASKTSNALGIIAGKSRSSSIANIEDVENVKESKDRDPQFDRSDGDSFTEDTASVRKEMNDENDSLIPSSLLGEELPN